MERGLSHRGGHGQRDLDVAMAIGVAAALMIPRRNRKPVALVPVLQPVT
jgi:hypothetical protein